MPQSEIPGKKLDRLAAVIKDSGARTKRWFVGWSDLGYPMLTSDRTTLSEAATQSYNLSDSVDFPLRELSSFPIPVEFLAVGKPIDKPDRTHQDILQFGVIDPSGNQLTVFVNELDFLDSITAGVVRWSGINRNTLLSGEVVPAIETFSFVVRGKTDTGEDQEGIFLMLFPQPVDNESNKVAFHGFLYKSMQALISLDVRQSEVDKKGYQASLYDHMELDASGGDAYDFLNFLRSIGFYNNSEQGMKDILLESNEKDFKKQLYIIARELGLYDDEPSPKIGSRENLEQLGTQQLLDLFLLMRRKVRSFFR